MKKIRSPRLWIVLGLLLVVVLSLHFAIERIVKTKLTQSIEDACETCEIQMGQVGVSLLGGHLSVSNIHFQVGNRKDTYVEVKVPSLSVDVAPLSLVFGTPKIGSIRIHGPEVKIIEGDLPTSSSKSSSKKRAEFQVGSIEVTNADFVYERVHHSQAAPIHLSHIHAKTGEAGTTPELINQPVQAHLTAVLEDSGLVKIALEAWPFGNAPHALIDLKLTEQKLAAVNGYLHTNDGIDLDGLLLIGHAHMKLEGKHIAGKFTAAYKGLDVKFEAKEGKRNGLEALLQNIGTDIKIKPTKLSRDKAELTKPIEAIRKPDESVISFILRGMRDAAIKVVTS